MDSIFEGREIRALSWKQPYAELMLYGKIETRVWETNYRGLVLICASHKPYSKPQIKDIWGEKGHERIYNQFNNRFLINGHAIAIGELIDCRKMKPEDEDDCFVTYHHRLFCHVYQNVRSIEPFPFKGNLKWKKLDKETLNKIKFI